MLNEIDGSQSENWRTQVTTYQAVQYQQLYRGISLRFDGQDGRLKSTFQIAPGADPSQIRWRYQGIDTAQIDPTTGNLTSRSKRA